MRTLVHLSDLHFGRVDEAIIEPLIARVNAIAPDLVVVSGDLTQRARTEQFRAARLFLDALPKPQIVVPGNHDMPLHNVFSRFMRPFKKYQRYIANDLEPVHVDDEIAVIGINTARSLTFKDGRIDQGQIAHLRARLNPLDEHLVKIIVTHHPFDLPGHFDDKALVGRARAAMDMFANCGADLLLAGHMHISHAGSSAARHKIKGYSALVAQAGTATSTRGRGESNSFNEIRISASLIAIRRFEWIPERAHFAAMAIETFERKLNAWSRVEELVEGVS
jgi:3',5'-cyclic AMP phosphodiesterase CpdA